MGSNLAGAVALASDIGALLVSVFLTSLADVIADAEANRRSWPSSQRGTVPRIIYPDEVSNQKAKKRTDDETEHCPGAAPKTDQPAHRSSIPTDHRAWSGRLTGRPPAQARWRMRLTQARPTLSEG
jgi:hypothetical protein